MHVMEKAVTNTPYQTTESKIKISILIYCQHNSQNQKHLNIFPVNQNESFTNDCILISGILGVFLARDSQ
jgi:hypothetical protein